VERCSPAVSNSTTEKALLDTLYIATRKSRRFAKLPEIRLDDANFDLRRCRALLKKLFAPPQIATAMESRLRKLLVLVRGIVRGYGVRCHRVLRDPSLLVGRSGIASITARHVGEIRPSMSAASDIHDDAILLNFDRIESTGWGNEQAIQNTAASAHRRGFATHGRADSRKSRADSHADRHKNHGIAKTMRSPRG